MPTKDKDECSISMGFEYTIRVTLIKNIIPLKSLRTGAKESKKYTQILSSVKEIGLVEAPVIISDSKNPHTYFLLDGLLRIEALKDIGIEEVECLISTDDEAYTYNKKINRLSAVQEHRMIVRAVDRGVPPERIAAALELDVTTIQRRFRMLDGICPEVAEMLKDTTCPMRVFEILRQMAPIRQIEATDLMIGQNNYSTMFANALLAATHEDQLIKSRKRKSNPRKAVTSKQIALLERELASLQTQVRSFEESYGVDNLNFTVAKGYITKLLSNPRIVRWLEQNRHEYLTEFKDIAEIDRMDFNSTNKPF